MDDQRHAPNSMDAETRGSLAELKNLLHEFDTAMFVTVTQDKLLRARPMAIQKDAPEMDADLWFVASMDSAKMREIEQRPSVCVTCLRGSASAYISISADARVRRDPALVRKLFQPDWKIWWPDGPDDPSITFIEMTVIRAEYWEPAGGKVRILYELVKSLVKGEPGDANFPPPKKL